MAFVMTDAQRMAKALYEIEMMVDDNTDGRESAVLDAIFALLQEAPLARIVSDVIEPVIDDVVNGTHERVIIED